MPARTTALAALIACRRAGAWSDGILKEYLARDGLDRRDAALATQLCCGVMQQRLLLDWRLRQVSSQPLEKLQLDTERDNYMSAQQAKEYGLIDEVITHR